MILICIAIFFTRFATVLLESDFKIGKLNKERSLLTRFLSNSQLDMLKTDYAIECDGSKQNNIEIKVHLKLPTRIPKRGW